MKWVLYSSDGNFFTASSDQTVKWHRKDNSGNYYELRSLDVSSIGNPHCLNTNIEDVLMVAIADQINLYYITGSNFEYITKITETANIFVFDLSSDLDYMVVGMQNGEVPLYESNFPPEEQQQ